VDRSIHGNQKEKRIELHNKRRTKNNARTRKPDETVHRKLSRIISSKRIIRKKNNIALTRRPILTLTAG